MVRLPFWLGWTSPEKTLPTTGLWGEPAGARPGREIQMGSVSSLVLSSSICPLKGPSGPPDVAWRAVSHYPPVEGVVT